MRAMQQPHSFCTHRPLPVNTQNFFILKPPRERRLALGQVTRQRWRNIFVVHAVAHFSNKTSLTRAP